MLPQVLEHKILRIFAVHTDYFIAYREAGAGASRDDVVPNGIPLSKIHHATFDAHLIGIDPNYRLHLSPQLLDQNDGTMLDYPDRDRLSLR